VAQWVNQPGKLSSKPLFEGYHPKNQFGEALKGLGKLAEMGLLFINDRDKLLAKSKTTVFRPIYRRLLLKP
jgi:hypothetical protein